MHCPFKIIFNLGIHNIIKILPDLMRQLSVFKQFPVINTCKLNDFVLLEPMSIISDANKEFLF